MTRRTSEELLSLFKENWPEGYSASEEVMLRLYHSALRHTESMQTFLAQFGVTSAEFVVLRVIRREPEAQAITPTMICEALVLSPGGVTKILKQLEGKGLVTRSVDHGDKRRSLVRLTEEGEDKINSVQRAVREFDTVMLGRTLTEREQTRLAELLRKLPMSLEPSRSASALVAAARLSAEEVRTTPEA